MTEGWNTIESDPGVFTDLIARFGVNNVIVNELFDLDQLDSLEKPIYGLIFLFKYDKQEPQVSASRDVPYDLFFANQVVHNACATQALLAVLLNNPEIDLGTMLSEFKTFCHDLPFDLRGMAIGSHSGIRDVHNSSSFQLPLDFDKATGGEKGEAYHFISYVFFRGHIYELDGLQSGPIQHTAADASTWVEAAKPIIMERIGRYQSGEIHFNLLSVSGDPSALLKEKADGGDQTAARELELLKTRKEEWQRENEIRKFNFTPFLMHLLSSLSEEEVNEMLEQAEKKS